VRLLECFGCRVREYKSWLGSGVRVLVCKLEVKGLRWFVHYMLFGQSVTSADCEGIYKAESFVRGHSPGDWKQAWFVK